MKMQNFARASFMFFPMGLLAIADKCYQQGYSVQIVNYPMEHCFDHQWSLEQYLKDIDFKVCGIDLHWVNHSYGAIEVAKIVKKVNPNAKVVLGGYTATYFHEELMKYYNTIDGIVRGEGEIPFLNYVQRVTRDQSFQEVPNLCYRDSSQHIKVNPITYVADTIEDLNFTNISLLHNGKKYVEYSREIMAIPFNLAMARGCPYQCPYCGGGRKSQYLLNKRRKVLLRSPEKLIDDLHDIFDNYNAGGIFFGHGTYPSNLKYWKKLFNLIRKEKFDMAADLEIWRFPFPKEMWQDFYKTFRLQRSSISICPRTFSTRVQQKIATICDPTFQFPRNQIEDLLKNSTIFGITLRLWLTIGFPFQKLIDLINDYIHTIKLSLKYGKSNFTPITVMNDLVNISPASPAYEEPDLYGITLDMTSFRQIADIWKRTKFSMGGWNSVTNYHTKNFSSSAIRTWNVIFLLSSLPMFLTSFQWKEKKVE